MSQEGGRNGLKIAVVFLVLVIVVILLMTPSVQNTVAEFLFSPFQEKVPKYAVYRVERNLRVDANGGTVYNFTLDVPVPQYLGGNGYSLQDVSSITVVPEAQELLRYGVQWQVWEHGPLSGAQTYTVSTTYEVRVDTHIWDLDEASSGDVGDVPASLRDSYLHDEWKMIVSDSHIQQKAQMIVGDEENVYLILERIYEWVVGNVDYPSADLAGDPSSSLETLSSLVGDCDDQAILFCSLARAAGVPAWLQLGALYNSHQDSWNGHGWVQAYVPLNGGGGEVVTIDTVNRDFMLWMPNRLAEYTDDGNGQHLRDYYYSFTYTYDTNSYPSTEGPEYSEAYVSLTHEESDEKVQVGTIFQMVQGVTIWCRIKGL